MATDFSGTNTERTDKLVVAVVELRTTARLMLMAVGIVGPIMVGILSFLLSQASVTNAKLERLTERVEGNTGKLERLTERVDAMAVKLDRIAAQLDRMEKAGKP